MNNNGGFCEKHCGFERDINREDNEQSQSSMENSKVLKTIQYMQNMRFSQLTQVACKSPGQVAKNLRDKILKNLSKCFS